MDRSPDARPGPRAPYELGPVLQQIARTTARSLGFRTTVINLYRPAWDDFEVVVVHGTDEARRVLLGQPSSWEDWTPLLDARFERGGAYFIAHGEFDWTQDRLLVLRAGDRARSTGAGRLAPRGRAVRAAALGRRRAARASSSVDEPLDGRRPGDEQLDVLGAVAAHAALALEHAQQAAAEPTASAPRSSTCCASPRSSPSAARVDEMLARRLRRRPRRARLREGHASSCSPSDALLAAAPRSPRLGRDERSRARRAAARRARRLLDPAHAARRAACCSSPRGGRAAAPAPASARRLHRRPPTAAGRRAWNHHWLLVPLHDRDGRARRDDLGRRARRPPAARPTSSCRRCARSPTRR